MNDWEKLRADVDKALAILEEIPEDRYGPYTDDCLADALNALYDVQSDAKHQPTPDLAR